VNLIASKHRATKVQKPRKIRALTLLVLLAAALAGATATPADDEAGAPGNHAMSAAGKAHRRKPASAPTALALPADVKVPSYTPGFFPFHDGERLVYEASWLGIPAARGWFELHRNKKDPSLWNVEAWIETNKVVDLVFRMRDYMRERVAVNSLKVQDIYQVQHENQRANEYIITFDDKSNLVVSTKTAHNGAESHEFISNDPFGPISGAMMALSQDLAPGRRLLFDVFSGINRYVFDFNVEGKERVVVPVGSYDALKVSPGIVYLSNGKLRRQARETTIWISADKGHLPLRMEAATFIGSVRADLVQIDGPPPGQEE